MKIAHIIIDTVARAIIMLAFVAAFVVWCGVATGKI